MFVQLEMTKVQPLCQILLVEVYSAIRYWGHVPSYSEWTLIECVNQKDLCCDQRGGVKSQYRHVTRWFQKRYLI